MTQCAVLLVSLFSCGRLGAGEFGRRVLARPPANHANLERKTLSEYLAFKGIPDQWPPEVVGPVFYQCRASKVDLEGDFALFMFDRK